MSLDDLQKKLYDPDSGIEKRTHEFSQFDPLISNKADASNLQKEKKWQETKDENRVGRIKMLKIGALSLGIIIFISLSTFAFVKFRESAFKEKNVTVKIEGPAEVNSSQTVTYKIFLKNDNRTSLKNAKILLNYPENFKPEENQDLKIDNPSNSRIELGDIKGHSAGEKEIRGSFLAAKDSTIYINVVIQYAPSSFSSVFNAKSQLGVKIDSSPVFLDIQAPLEFASGNKVDYVIDYRNSSSQYFNGLKIKIEYPEEFSFSSSNPASSEGNNIWYIGSLNPEQSGKIIISGDIKGEGEESKIVRAYIGVSGENGEFIIYDQKEKLSKITPTLLSIRQSVNERTSLNINPGEELRYSLNYINNGDIDLKDTIITLEINSEILDFSKLKMIKGSYDSSKKTITWRASEIPQLSNLEPGAKGEISFSIPVLDRIPIDNSNDKNFTIVSTAKIDSPSIPNPIGSNKIIASNKIELKLNSRAVLDIKGYHNDPALSNFGPIPPKVGEETSYTLHWKVINISNNINDVKVVSSLPSGVKWTGKIYPSQESISFNERTNQIEWLIGSLENGVGIISPAKEVIFQISVIPQINQVGDAIKLINSSVLTANDLFTGAEIRFEAKEKDTWLQEDSSITSNDYKAVN